MNLFPYNPKCKCRADVTKATSMREVWRGKPLSLRRAQMVFHYREEDQAYFWHWSDQDVVVI